MPLVTTKEMMAKAQKSFYAVGAFNVENLEMIKAVLDVAEEMKAPVILQTTPSTVRYGNLLSFAAMVRAEAEKRQVEAALHLDHGNSVALAAQALRNGYTSLMIDGSGESFERNIEMTKRVVEMAHPNQIPVEAELGKVGGKEDDLERENDGYTDPKQACEFVERTGVDSLAVAIGTAHGFYKETPVLDQNRLKEIRRVVSVPLVLHGASGLGEEEIAGCIEKGICKVNFATELRVAYTDGVKKILKEHPDTYDPKKLGEAGMEGVRQITRNKIRICGCQGKAGL